MAVPKRNQDGNASPRAHAHASKSAMLLAALFMAQGCREKLEPASAGGVQVLLPAFAGKSGKDDAASGYLERADGRGSRAVIAWDVDPRPGPVTESEARAAAGRPDAEATAAQVSGHPAILLRGMKGATLVWRCDKSARLFRLASEGPRSREVAELAAHARCHAERLVSNGEVPAVATAALGASFRFANRGRGSISYVSDDAVLTLFAGQSLSGPRDVEAARQEAPAWIAAAGLADAQVQSAELAPGPQSHPGIEVQGAAVLQGRPVRWTLLFWRCLQRQKTFAGVVFGSGEHPPDPSPLLAARCHG